MNTVKGWVSRYTALAVALAALAVCLLFDGPIESLAVFAGGGLAVAATIFPAALSWIKKVLRLPDS